MSSRSRHPVRLALNSHGTLEPTAIPSLVTTPSKSSHELDSLSLYVGDSNFDSELFELTSVSYDVKDSASLYISRKFEEILLVSQKHLILIDFTTSSTTSVSSQVGQISNLKDLQSSDAVVISLDESIIYHVTADGTEIKSKCNVPSSPVDDDLHQNPPVVSTRLSVKLVLADVAQHLKASSIVQACQGTDGPVNLVKKIRSGEKLNVEEAGQIALCMNLQAGVMNENGDIFTDNLRPKLERRLGYSKAKIVIDDCGTRNGNSVKEVALNFVKCMQKYLGFFE
ncbi:unnamed protein product [Diabrotica balteata]|uniref:Uncharacterized protein n=1 Tax=Diabrotica balteata TaxID=107213 RepID=A0A9P0GY20_DIABA|nr:unnamed protein product [Diabrotica balteata]